MDKPKTPDGKIVVGNVHYPLSELSKHCQPDLEQCDKMMWEHCNDKIASLTKERDEAMAKVESVLKDNQTAYRILEETTNACDEARSERDAFQTQAGARKKECFELKTELDEARATLSCLANHHRHDKDCYGCNAIFEAALNSKPGHGSGQSELETS